MRLGELERDVMEVFWADHEAPLTVRDVCAYFPDHAYTTVMTVLSRLTTKGFLTDDKVGRLNTFTATASREEYITSLILDALSSTDDRQAVLARFADAMPSSDRRFLRSLFTHRRK